jgi:hypothetical protein
MNIWFLNRFETGFTIFALIRIINYAYNSCFATSGIY